jgi:hypothetical protein
VPIPPPTLTPPYDTAETVLEFARVRLNDAIQSIGGEVLTDTAVFTQTYFNLAYRRLQEEMADLGSVRTNGHVYLPGLPPAGTTDPGTQVQLTWQYYFDGAGNYYAPPVISVLPQDMMEMLKLKQRPAGQPCSFREVNCSPNGLPSDTKLQFQRHWMWREDGLWMTGATQAVDLEVDYIAYLPDIVNNFPLGLTPWYQQQVPIVRCAQALAYYLAAEVGGARGDVDADAIEQKGDREVRKMLNRQFRSRQRVNQRRKSYRSCSQRSNNWGVY